MRLLADHLAPRIIGRDADRIEAIWHELEFATHATTIGAITAHRARRHRHRALGPARPQAEPAALEARRRRQGAAARSTPPRAAGCTSRRRPWSTTRWRRKAKGFRGSKVKIGRPHGSEDLARLSAVRAGGRRRLRDHDRLPTRASPSTRRSAAPTACASSTSPGSRSRSPPTTSTATSACRTPAPRRRSPSASCSTRSGISANTWRGAAARSCRSTSGRIGGITPWLKVAHAAEAFDMPVCPHFLMELHVSLVCAVPERQIRGVHPPARRPHRQAHDDRGRPRATPRTSPGLGIDWDWDAVKRMSVQEFTREITGEQ